MAFDYCFNYLMKLVQCYAIGYLNLNKIFVLTQKQIIFLVLYIKTYLMFYLIKVNKKSKYQQTICNKFMYYFYFWGANIYVLSNTIRK